jgi:hypothetical protein
MARIACGAAIENIARTAEHNGWRANIELHDSSLRLSTIRLAGDFSKSGKIDDAIRNRETNRKPYDGDPLPKSVLNSITESLIAAAGTEINFICQGADLREFANAIGRADGRMFANPTILRAFLGNVRFDQPDDAAVDEGLPIGSLELSRMERFALPHLRRLPAVIVRSWPTTQGFRRKARRLVLSSSGLCVITSSGNGPAIDVALGRSMQRTWLAFTEHVLAVQPMMSLPVLLNVALHSTTDHSDAIDAFSNEIPRRCPAGRCLAENASSAMAILRFGRAPRATARAGRRPFDRVTSPMVSSAVAS